MKMKEELMKEIALMGSIVTYFSVIAMALIFEKYIFAKTLITALLTCFFIIYLTRTIWFRARPEKVDYTGWFSRIDASSFPSMHAMRSMVLALLIGNFFQNPLVYALTILLALLTGFSRIYNKRHHLTDVVAGYIIAILIFLVLT